MREVEKVEAAASDFVGGCCQSSCGSLNLPQPSQPPSTNWDLTKKNCAVPLLFRLFPYFCAKFCKTEHMAGNRTFTMIKPDAVAAGHIGAILAQINEAGFRIVAMKLTKLSQEKAGEFYEVHKERPFYGELVDFMSSGPIVAAILEKDNAVADFRTLIGATNPANAEPGTIRARFAKSMGENAVHGSDSDENAAIEGAFHFAGTEQF